MYGVHDIHRVNHGDLNGSRRSTEAEQMLNNYRNVRNSISEVKDDIYSLRDKHAFKSI